MKNNIRRHLKYVQKGSLFLVALAFSFFLLSTSNVSAAQITLGWSPNLEQDLAGYRLYYQSREITATTYGNRILAWQGCIHGAEYCPANVAPISELIDDPEHPGYTISVLEGIQYRFVLRAFDDSGNESLDSAPACWPYACDAEPPAPNPEPNPEPEPEPDPEPEPEPDNVPPDKPLLLYPNGQDEVSLTPELTTHPFTDADGDSHVATTWQVAGSQEDLQVERLVFEAHVYDGEQLEKLVVPQGVLDGGRIYHWRVRFYDRWSESSWSYGEFTTEVGDDLNPKNGIPDYQEVTTYLDLDGNGISDLAQTNMTCVQSESGDIQISLEQGANVASVQWLEFVEPETIWDTEGAPDEMPFGLIAFRISLLDPSDPTAQVTIHFSEPVPSGAGWYKYDSINGWQPGELAILWAVSKDRKSVTLSLIFHEHFE